MWRGESLFVVIQSVARVEGDALSPLLERGKKSRLMSTLRVVDDVPLSYYLIFPNGKSKTKKLLVA